MFRSASSWKIVRGDKVQVMAGKDKGKQGEVLKVIRDQRFPRVFVSGVNMVSTRGALLQQHCTSLHLCYCYCFCCCLCQCCNCILCIQLAPKPQPLL
jgi:hypothetical protein